MKFVIKVNKKRAKLILDMSDKIYQSSIPSDRRFSEELLPAIDKLLKKAKLTKMPKFYIKCSDDASMISCNIARATAKALNLEYCGRL